MSPDQVGAVADVLGGFVEVSAVPTDFEQNMRNHIASRPSPTGGLSQLDRIEQKLDRLLALGGSE